jgi:hypothetical protein
MRRLLDFLSPESRTAANPAAKTLGRLWCRTMHASITWPIHGSYKCTACGRLYQVPWVSAGNEDNRSSVRLNPQSLSRPV